MRRREFLSGVAGCAAAIGLMPAAEGLCALGVGGDVATIHLNQAGFLPQREKLASVTSQAASFVVRSAADNSIFFRGDLSAARVDEASGDGVRLGDFSKLTRPGLYRLELNTGERSAPFAVGRGVYRDA